MTAPPPANNPTQQPQGQQPAAPGPSLPPTGLQQQLGGVNRQVLSAHGTATNAGQGASQGQPQQPQSPQYGGTNLNQMAQRLAQSYGLDVGRGDLVDQQGNFLMTPDQLAPQQGSGSAAMGGVAAKMNMISSALANEQTRQGQQKGIAAIQTGLGQVQSRGRGSLASMQSGMYQDLADLYSNQEYEAADFSYFIQQSMFNQAAHQAHRARKRGKKNARMGLIGSVIGAGIGAMTPMGAGAGAAMGGGMGQAGSAGGWF